MLMASQIKSDALEEVAQVVDAKTAPLEHLQLGVQPFHKAAVLPLPKVVDQFACLITRCIWGAGATLRRGFWGSAPERCPDRAKGSGSFSNERCTIEIVAMQK